MKRALIVTATALLAASPAQAWLDAASPANWNVPAASLPAAPGPKDSELESGGRCASEVRPPSFPEDRAVVRKGWSLVGPYERYGRISVFLATSSADGMCRPNGYQGFVFVNGAFAGTLSPHLMNARADASIAGLGVALYDERGFSATFVRYSESDALCCPHASTSVSYTIKNVAGHPIAEPVAAQTNKNAP